MKTWTPRELWYENDQGDRWFPSGLQDPPSSFRHQHTRELCSVREKVYDVAMRLPVFTGNTTWSPEIALTLARPTLLERLRQLLRYGWPFRAMPLRHAIAYQIDACERCVNALAHRAGAAGGYRRGSAAWRSTNTSCGLCRRPDERAA